MELVRQFSALSRHDTSLAGGKGASLGEMTQAGIPVPPGFVLLASAFERFMDETDLSSEVDAILHTVNREQVHTVEHASLKIQSLILAASMPEDIKEEIQKNFKVLGAPYVAVRSSATAEDSASAAWAGQLDSFLNTTEETLLQNIQRCWASLFTPRAIFYRFEKELHKQKISVAVVVQKMVESDCSGIAFSVHPITEDHNQLIIEAGYGLGEAIVSGQITPDSYVVEKNPRRIIDANASTQVRGLYRKENGGNEWRDVKEPQASSQVLSEAQILELSEIIVTIENHYGFPSDIEWASERGRFYIVQSRPITTLSNASNARNQTIDVPEEKVNPKEYSYYYGGGALFLPLDLISQYYGARGLRAEFITFIENNQSTTFLSNATLGRLHKEGLAHTLEEVKQKTEELQRLMDACAQKTSELEGVSVIDEAKCKEVFSDIGAILELYSIFDFKLWDGVFALFQTDKEKGKIVEYVQNHKNIIRASLGTILFEKEGYLCTLLKKLSEMRAVHLDDLLNCSMADILSIVHGSTVSESIESNKNLSCFVFQDGEYHVYHKDEALALWQKFNIPGKEKNVFQGKVGNVGKPKVRGKVFLIKNYTSVAEVTKRIEEDMQSGDILVSETTNPDIITAFKKAAAVITDTGGLLSHAAITSRELGITCVIDTEDTSKHLQSGDEVEVDGEKGVVTILERAKPVILSRIYSREKWLYYISLWYEVDALAIRDFFKNTVGNFVAIYKGPGKKTSIWMDTVHYKELIDLALEELRQESSIAWVQMQKIMLESWKYLEPYAKEAKRLDTKEELALYVRHLSNFWRGLNSVAFEVASDPRLPEDKRSFLQQFRATTEHYSERMSVLPGECFVRLFGEHAGVMHLLTLPEFLKVVKGEVVDFKKVAEREEGFFMLNGEIYPLNELENILQDKRIELERPVTTTELKGMAAYPGRVQGRVAIVDGFSDLENVQEGSILVTQMTNPKYVPAMKKVAAIITDEGGVLCHAAIVARELKKPCVIGTGSATDILQNGDLVEVDADKGVVTILR